MNFEMTPDVLVPATDTNSIIKFLAYAPVGLLESVLKHSTPVQRAESFYTLESIVTDICYGYMDLKLTEAEEDAVVRAYQLWGQAVVEDQVSEKAAREILKQQMLDDAVVYHEHRLPEQQPITVPLRTRTATVPGVLPHEPLPNTRAA